MTSAQVLDTVAFILENQAQGRHGIDLHITTEFIQRAIDRKEDMRGKLEADAEREEDGDIGEICEIPDPQTPPRRHRPILRPSQEVLDRISENESPKSDHREFPYTSPCAKSRDHSVCPLQNQVDPLQRRLALISNQLMLRFPLCVILLHPHLLFRRLPLVLLFRHLPLRLLVFRLPPRLLVVHLFLLPLVSQK